VRNSLPHRGVYTRLKPSTVDKAGVGVFAIRKIPKGAAIFLGDEETETIEVDKSEVAKAPPELRKLYDDFCIIENHGRVYRCPKNFNLLTPAWYLNEPRQGEEPNIRCGENYLFYALRDIEPGEELTVDYKTYNEFE
jgi:SET domain-containing protein